MDFVALFIGFVIGALLVLILKPKKTQDKVEVVKLQALLSQQKSEIDILRAKNERLVAEAAANKIQVDTLKDVREKMLNDFKAVSFELIEKQKESVVEKQKIVLDPMAKEMKSLKEDFEKKITEMLKMSAENKISVDEHINNMISKTDSLQNEANNLANALKNKKTQGCWGEMYLDNILQMLGLVEGVDYTKEEFFRNKNEDEKSIRPDFIVNLPNNRRIIIDSKVSMESYIKYENEEDEELREQYAEEFIRATEAHVKELSDKEYQAKVKDSGLDYVFMFMPLESAYVLAMRKKPELYTSAQSKNVALITSSLLFPMLKTVEMLLKLDKQNKNISEVVDIINRLYEKYVNFTNSFASVGSSLESAQKTYNTALKQLSDGRDNMSSLFRKVKDKSGIVSNKTIALEYKDEDE